MSSFEKKTVPELKALAKKKGLKGYSKLRKAELIKLLKRKRAPAKAKAKPQRKLSVQDSYEVPTKGKLSLASLRKMTIPNLKKLRKATLNKMRKLNLINKESDDRAYMKLERLQMAVLDILDTVIAQRKKGKPRK